MTPARVRNHWNREDGGASDRRNRFDRPQAGSYLFRWPNPTKSAPLKMSHSELTAAQCQILEKLPESVEIGRLDRLWIFEPQVNAARETGLFVISVRSGSRQGGEMRELVTVRYTLEQSGPQPRLDTQVMSEGWAPPGRIDRVMAGVLARIGDGAADPREEVLGPGEDWEALLLRLDPSG